MIFYLSNYTLHMHSKLYLIISKHKLAKNSLRQCPRWGEMAAVAAATTTTTATTARTHRKLRGTLRRRETFGGNVCAVRQARGWSYLGRAWTSQKGRKMLRLTVHETPFKFPLLVIARSENLCCPRHLQQICFVCDPVVQVFQINPGLSAYLCKSKFRKYRREQ